MAHNKRTKQTKTTTVVELRMSKVEKIAIGIIWILIFIILYLTKIG